MSKQKLSNLRNELERSIFKAVKDSAESSFDKANLYARKKGLPIDPAVLNDVLGAMRTSFVSDVTNKLDAIHGLVETEVVKVLDAENPTLRKKSSKLAAGETSQQPTSAN